MFAYIEGMLAVSSSSSRGRLDRLELYRLLADADRLRILALCAEERLSVGELSELLGESQPNISRKTSPLRQAGLLEGQRDGTRLWLSLTPSLSADVVVADALEEGRKLCVREGTLARVPRVVAAREEAARAFFDDASLPAPSASPAAAPFLAHLMALSGLLPRRALAVDMGTGDGALIDVLAPLYERVIAVDRSPARLARCAARVAERGFHHVSLLQGDFDDAALLERVDRAGGADLVFASMCLHHASRPQQAVASFARLLKRGGTLQILDYAPHGDERLRETQGDVWLGFHALELERWASTCGLEWQGARLIPPLFHRGGDDAHLDWQVVSARRPVGKASQTEV